MTFGFARPSCLLCIDLPPLQSSAGRPVRAWFPLPSAVSLLKACTRLARDPRPVMQNLGLSDLLTHRLGPFVRQALEAGALAAILGGRAHKSALALPRVAAGAAINIVDSLGGAALSLLPAPVGQAQCA